MTKPLRLVLLLFHFIWATHHANRIRRETAHTNREKSYKFGPYFHFQSVILQVSAYSNAAWVFVCFMCFSFTFRCFDRKKCIIHNVKDFIWKSLDELMQAELSIFIRRIELSYRELSHSKILSLVSLCWMCPWNHVYYIRPIRPLCFHDNMHRWWWNGTVRGEMVPIRVSTG